jgi:hypothetical protein
MSWNSALVLCCSDPVDRARRRPAEKLSAELRPYCSAPEAACMPDIDAAAARSRKAQHLGRVLSFVDDERLRVVA